MSKESTGYLVLAADTSSSLASFAIVRGEKLLASLSGGAHLPHSQTFFSSLSILLQLADIEITEIDAFAAVTGPGSFTGLRVGLAAIKGLAHTLSQPAIGISSFDAVALGTGAAGLVLVMIDAGREEVYCGLRKVHSDGKIESLGEDSVGRPAFVLSRSVAGGTAGPLVIAGNGAAKFRDEIEIAARSVGADLLETRHLSLSAQSWQLKLEYSDTAVMIAKSAARLLKSGIISEIHPYYIRPSDAEIKSIGRV
jgi:tRNA threonylcarbamoyladenosine biosynthesis protein TsaB